MARLVSIIVPVYNEAATIASVLQAVCEQSCPVSALEVIVADGRSSDGTREAVEAFCKAHPELRVLLIENPDRSIPAALNRAIAAAHGESILRLDGHSLPYPDYVARCLEALESTGAANVGGQWDIRPSGTTWLAKAIAVAVAHPLGAGDARYRTSGVAGEVETVPFGAFPRAWLERVGGYDESLLTNEDYELNLRLRQAGGRIWFDPQIRSIYFARPSIPALARQYLRYGYWKARMIVRHPRSLRWRQALPPLFVGLTAGVALLAAAWPPALRLLGLQWLAYLAVLLAAAAREASHRRDWALLVGLPLAFVTIHLCWGSAFLVGLLVPPGRGRSDRGA